MCSTKQATLQPKMLFYITKLLESQAFGRCLELVTGRTRDLCQKPWRCSIIDDTKSLPPNWSTPLCSPSLSWHPYLMSEGCYLLGDPAHLTSQIFQSTGYWLRASPRDLLISLSVKDRC